MGEKEISPINIWMLVLAKGSSSGDLEEHSVLLLSVIIYSSSHNQDILRHVLEIIFCAAGSAHERDFLDPAAVTLDVDPAISTLPMSEACSILWP